MTKYLNRAFLPSLLLLNMVFIACGESSDQRDAVNGSCSGICTSVPTGGSAVTSSSSGDSGSSGSAGSAGDSSGSWTLTPELVVGLDIDSAASAWTPFVDRLQFELKSENDSGAISESIDLVESTFGPGKSADWWLTATPTGEDSGLFMPTMLFGESAHSGSPRVPVFTIDAWDTFAQGLIGGVGFNPLLAHLVVTAVDSDGRLLSQVSWNNPDPGYAYDLGPTFSDQTTGTGTRGLMILMNQSAGSSSGGVLKNITIDYEGTSRSIEFRLLNGMVTVAQIVLAP